MELAVILAAGLRDWIDFGVIIAILLLNAAVGWYQEKQAADVVASLKGDIAMKAVVIRQGQEQDIKARELVPGDIVVIEEGEEGEGEGIPHQGHSIIAADQSAITGESLAVDKFMGDMVYYTTGCKRGKAYAVCTTSAKFSFVGRTATLVQGAKDQGHL